MSGGIRITSPTIARCLARNGIPEQLFKDAFGDVEGVDYDMATFQLKKNEWQAEQLQKVRIRKLQSIADQRNILHIDGYEGSKKEALISLVGRSRDEAARSSISIEARSNAIMNQTLGTMFEAVKKYQPKMLGLRHSKEGLENIARELFGKDTGDADAAALAAPIKEAFEALRTRWNTAGGSIKKLSDWGMPQSHDAAAIQRAGFNEWATFTTRRLDWERMGIPAEERGQVLEKIFKSITGTPDLKEDVEWKQMVKSTRAQIFADKNSASRFLHFSDPEQWLEYQHKYGSKDIFGTILKHVRDMSDDIALVETLGPDPDTAFKKLATYVNERYKQDGRIMSAPAEKMFEVFRGKIGPENIKAARAMAAVRSVSATSRAGKILLSALTDIPISTMRALYSGLGSSRALRLGVRQVYNILTQGDAEKVARMGILSDAMLSFHRIAGRFEEDSYVSKLTRVYSEFTFRATGLNRWTEGCKLGFAMEFSYAMGDLSKHGWKQLSQQMRNTLERYGLDKVGWNSLRLQMRQDKGGLYLDPSYLKDRELQAKVTAMIREETRAAILEPGLRESTVFQTVAAGTALGETIRSFGVFKSFALTYINSVLFPIIAKKTPWQSRVTQAAFIMAVLPVFGWVSHAAKQITAGDKPADPFEDFESFSKAYGAGFMQAGGIGIMGDFLFTDENRFGGGFISTAAGPVASDLMDIKSLIMGAITQMFSTDDQDVARQAVRKAEQFTPGTNLWFTRLPAQRLVYDKMEQAADPNWWKKNSARERKKRREGTTGGQWWKP